jgi:hypothetical protein
MTSPDDDTPLFSPAVRQRPTFLKKSVQFRIRSMVQPVLFQPVTHGTEIDI